MSNPHPENPYLPDWVEEGMLVKYIGNGSNVIPKLEHGDILRVSWDHIWRDHPRLFPTTWEDEFHGYKMNTAGGPSCWKRVNSLRKTKGFSSWIQKVESNAE